MVVAQINGMVENSTSSDSALIHTLQLVLRVACLLGRHNCGFLVNCSFEEVKSRTSLGREWTETAGSLLLFVVATVSKTIEVSRDGRDSWKEWLVKRIL